jgi:hypothetical protein
MDVAIQVGKSLRIYMTVPEDIEMMTDGMCCNIKYYFSLL